MAAEGFLVSGEVGMVFFRACRMYKIDGKRERIELLRKLVARHKAKYIPHPDTFLKGKRILMVKRKEKPNEL